MVRKYRENDLMTVMQIWLDTNVKAHDFIPDKYWKDHYEMVKEMLPQAELYVYEDDCSGEAEGFIGLMEDYIAGIFVRDEAQSKGIGKQLLDWVKSGRKSLALHVYEKNERAVRFYRREGFTVQSEGLDESTGEKEILMSWRGDC